MTDDKTIKKFKLGPLQKRWIAYLKEHPEEQTTDRLGIIIGGQKKMCCLGAAGIIIKSCIWEGKVLIEKDSKSYSTLMSSYEKMGLRSSFGGNGTSCLI